MTPMRSPSTLRVLCLAALTMGISNCKATSSSEAQDIGSSVTITGRDGANYVYWLDLYRGEQGTQSQIATGVPSIFQAQCPNPYVTNRDLCQTGKRSVSLAAFLRAMVGGQAPDLLYAVGKLNTAKIHLAAAIAAAAVNDRVGQSATASEATALNAVVQDQADAAAKNSALAEKRLATNAAPLFNLIMRLASDDLFSYTSDSVGQLPPAERFYVEQLPAVMARAEAMEGRPCQANDASGLYVSDSGGCRDTTTNLVWGAVARSLDGRADDTWFDRDAAQAFCGGSNIGGVYDWRVPTKEELATVSTGAYNLLGLTTGLHYWTTSTGEVRKTESIEGQVAEQDILNNSSDLILGYSSWNYRSDQLSASNVSNSSADVLAGMTWGTPYFHSRSSNDNASASSNGNFTDSGTRAVTSKAYYTIKAINREVKGKVNIIGQEQYIVQMGTGKAVPLTKYSIESATGTLRSMRVDVTDKPVTAVEKSFNSSSHSYRGGSDTQNRDSNLIVGTAFDGFVQSTQFHASGSSSSSGNSNTTREAGRDRTVRILGNDVEKVNPLKFVAYKLPPNIEVGTIGVACVRKK